MAARKRVSLPELVEKLEGKYGRAEYAQRFDPTSELVSCILSQHTTDAISFPTFYRLREMLPSWEAVVEAGEGRIAEIIKPAGLANQKARTILGCLRMIYQRFGSYSLADLKELSNREASAFLQSMPGVGPKTASIVLCFAFGRNVVPVDTHVYRVAVRLGVVPTEVSEAKAHPYLDARIPDGMAFRFHMALIAHGRAVCKARRPQCSECLLRDQCPSQKTQRGGRSFSEPTRTRGSREP
jgi:endonuclease-3